jgi:hypothetical protein
MIWDKKIGKKIKFKIKKIFFQINLINSQKNNFNRAIIINKDHSELWKSKFRKITKSKKLFTETFHQNFIIHIF